MEVLALIMEELINSVALVINHSSAKDVKSICASLLIVKMAELVLSILMGLPRQNAIVPIILEAKPANIFPVGAISPALMLEHVMVRRVNAAKRTELQTIMVKVVICRLLAMVTHVKMGAHVPARLKRMELRSVSIFIISRWSYFQTNFQNFDTI